MLGGIVWPGKVSAWKVLDTCGIYGIEERKGSCGVGHRNSFKTGFLCDSFESGSRGSSFGDSSGGGLVAFVFWRTFGLQLRCKTQVGGVNRILHRCIHHTSIFYLIHMFHEVCMGQERLLFSRCAV